MEISPIQLLGLVRLVKKVRFWGKLVLNLCTENKIFRDNLQNINKVFTFISVPFFRNSQIVKGEKILQQGSLFRANLNRITQSVWSRVAILRAIFRACTEDKEFTACASDGEQLDAELFVVGAANQAVLSQKDGGEKLKDGSLSLSFRREYIGNAQKNQLAVAQALLCTFPFLSLSLSLPEFVSSRLISLTRITLKRVKCADERVD